MGIKGLSSFLNKNPVLLEPYELHDTRVVFDGYNIANHLYYHYNVPCKYAGDYDRYGNVVKQYFSSYLECNIKPVVIFDGGQDRTDRKLTRILDRTKARIESVARISNRQSPSEDVLPVFAYNVFIDVIKKMNIDHAQSSFEADGPLIAIANYYRCPVISLDSDFYVFDIQFGFIRSDCVDTTPRVGGTGRHQYKYLRCTIYTIDRFLSFFPRVQKSVLPVFGTLLGNDFLDAPTTHHFLQSTGFPQGSLEYLQVDKRHERMLRLLKWLERYSNVDNAVADFVTHLPENERQPVRKLVKRAIDAYKVPGPYLLKYTDSFFRGSDLCLPDAAETLLTFGEKPFPTWFVDKFHKANISSYVMNIVGLRRMILPTQVENTESPSSHDCSLAIRRVLYGILTSLDGGLSGNTDEIYVEEYDREGTQILKKRIKPIMLLEGFGPLPNMSERRLSTREGKVLISCALGEQDTYFDDIPDFLQLIILNIRYWFRTCFPRPLEYFLDALLTTVLYLAIVEPAASDISGLVADGYKTFSPERYERASILDLVRDVEPRNAAFFSQQIRKYYQNLGYSRRNSVDMRIIHSYSQLQSCVLFSLLINEVTEQPFATPRMQCAFSGSLIYNLTSELCRVRSCQTFIAQTLGPGSTLEYLFRKLKSKILEN